MSVQVVDTKRLGEIEKDITDYLFERNHEINKPLIMDLAYWILSYGQKQYLQAQFDNGAVQTSATGARGYTKVRANTKPKRKLAPKTTNKEGKDNG